jgi:hypothetical protein
LNPAWGDMLRPMAETIRRRDAYLGWYFSLMMSGASEIPVGHFLGLASGHSLRISCVLKTTAAYRLPAPEVLPFAEQPHEADVQRVLDAVDERLYPELVNQFRDGRLDSRHR